MSFFTERSDLYGSKDRQNAMSRHCRGSWVRWKRWQSLSTMLSVCLSCRDTKNQDSPLRAQDKVKPFRCIGRCVS